MTTLNEMIEIIKAENPTIQVGDEQQGYTELNQEEYDAQVKAWAQGRLDKETKQAEELAAKLDAIAKVTALGIDPKVLGLVIEEKPTHSGTLD
jgi:hypothetical protein